MVQGPALAKSPWGTERIQISRPHTRLIHQNLFVGSLRIYCWRNSYTYSHLRSTILQPIIGHLCASAYPAKHNTYNFSHVFLTTVKWVFTTFVLPLLSPVSPPKVKSKGLWQALTQTGQDDTPGHQSKSLSNSLLPTSSAAC